MDMNSNLATGTEIQMMVLLHKLQFQTTKWTNSPLIHESRNKLMLPHSSKSLWTDDQTSFRNQNILFKFLMLLHSSKTEGPWAPSQ